MTLLFNDKLPYLKRIRELRFGVELEQGCLFLHGSNIPSPTAQTRWHILDVFVNIPYMKRGSAHRGS